MEDLINQAFKSLSAEDFKAFKEAADVLSIGTCLRVTVNNLSEALELLKENAIQNQCDPVVTEHYAESYRLYQALNKYIENGNTRS